MLENEENNIFKMIHVRNDKDHGVVSFRTVFDDRDGTVMWSMCVCSKKDQFEKKIARKLCEDAPLKHGITFINMRLFKSFKEEGYAQRYLRFKVIEHSLAANTVCSSEGDIRHTPKWADKLLIDELTDTVIFV